MAQTTIPRQADGGEHADIPDPRRQDSADEAETPASGPRPAPRDESGDDGMRYPDEGDFEEGYEGPGGQQGGAQRPFGERGSGVYGTLIGAALSGRPGAAAHVSKTGKPGPE